jgi:chemotaxis protein CheD
MENTKTKFIYPAGLTVEREPHILSTLLGSCVAVCIWDFKLKFGGMNHFILPLWNGTGLASPKFGNIAIEVLIDKMVGQGSQKENLVAKVFGGASMLSSQSHTYNIGMRNVELAQSLLLKSGINIVASSTGGIKGRKVLFNTNTGDVFLKFLTNNNTPETSG